MPIVGEPEVLPCKTQSEISGSNKESDVFHIQEIFGSSKVRELPIGITGRMLWPILKALVMLDTGSIK